MPAPPATATRRLVTGVVVPYVLFETAYGLFRRWAEHDPSQPISIFDPWYLTWFLVALGAVATAGLFCLSLLLTACFFAWVPRRRTWFTALGAGTLYGYLLHGFAVKTALSLGWFDPPWVHTAPGRVACTLIAAAVVSALCTPPVQRLFRFAVQPRMAWAFRRTETVSPGTR